MKISREDQRFVDDLRIWGDHMRSGLRGSKERSMKFEIRRGAVRQKKSCGSGDAHSLVLNAGSGREVVDFTRVG